MHRIPLLYLQARTFQTREAFILYLTIRLFAIDFYRVSRVLSDEFARGHRVLECKCIV